MSSTHILKKFAALTAIASLAWLSSCGHKQKTQAPPVTPQARVPRHPVAPAPIGTAEEGIASWYGPPYHGRQAANGEIYDMEKMTAAHRTLPFNTWVRVTNMSNGKFVDVRITDRGPFIAGRIIDLSKAAARDLELLGPGVGPVHLEVIRPPAVPAALAGGPINIASAVDPASVPPSPTPLGSAQAPTPQAASSQPSNTPSPEATSATIASSPEPAMAAAPDYAASYATASLPPIEPELYAVQIGAFSVLENAEHVRDQFARYGGAQLVARQGAPTLWRVVVGRFGTESAAQDLAKQLQSEVGHAVFVVHLDPQPLAP